MAEPPWLDRGVTPQGGDFLAATLAEAGLGWVVWDPESGQLDCSAEGGSLIGVGATPTPDIGAWLDAVVSADRPALQQALRADIGREPRRVAAIYRLDAAHGGPRHVQLRGRLERAPDGTVRGSALLLDVTELRTQAQLLRASEARFREAFQEAPVPMALTTPDDLLLDVNPAFVELSGYALDDIVGRNASELGFWSSPADQAQLHGFLDSENDAGTIDAHLRTSSGRVRDILVTITRTRLVEGGALVKVVLDVTERRGLQRKLAQALRATLSDSDWLAQRLLKELATLEGEPVEGPLAAEFTRRERQVLELLARGYSNESVAADLGITPSTVRNYVSALYSKLGVDSRAEAVVWAREHGLGGE